MLGREIAKVGEAETTITWTPYRGHGFVAWDVPGKHDGLSYFALEYISFMKGLTHRVILIRSSVKEMTKVCRLLDALKLHYTIVVNRFQLEDAGMETKEQREAFEQQIKQEVVTEKLTCAGDRVFFIAAKKPEKYPEEWHDLRQLLLTA